MKNLVIGAAVLVLAAIPGFAANVPVLGSAANSAENVKISKRPNSRTGAAPARRSSRSKRGEDVRVDAAPPVPNNAAVLGDVGLNPGSSITGFQTSPANTLVQGLWSTGLIAGPALVTGTITVPAAVAPANALQVQVDLPEDFTALTVPPTGNLSGQNLGGLTLTLGVYQFDAAAALTGPLQLYAQSAEYWVFQIPSTLTPANDEAVVEVVNDSLPGHTPVSWGVGTDATLSTNTPLTGEFLGATMVNGSALTQGAAVTLNTNAITTGFSSGLLFEDETDTTPVPSGLTPEPSTLALLGLSLAIACGSGRRRPTANGGGVPERPR